MNTTKQQKQQNDNAPLFANGGAFIGVVIGVKSEPWASDPTKTNHSIGISVPYTDEWGRAQDYVTKIGLGQNTMHLLGAAKSLIGQQVIVTGVGSRVVAPKPGQSFDPFINNYATLNTKLIPVNLLNEGAPF